MTEQQAIARQIALNHAMQRAAARVHTGVVASTEDVLEEAETFLQFLLGTDD